MIIQAFSCQPLSTNTYVIACPHTRKAAVVDPSFDSDPLILEFLTKNDLQLEKILLTHSHWDHIAGVYNLLEQLSVPVYIHSLDQPNLRTPGIDQLPMMIPFRGVENSLILKEDDLINVGDLLFKVIHTPGHSPGGVCFYCEKEGILISGDTLFKGSMGTLSLPTAQPERMWESLKKLSRLPIETKVYPGHGPSTTIGKESWLANAKEIFGY